MIRKHQPNKKLQPYGAGAWNYLRRLVFLRALGVTLTVIVTGTVTLRVVRVGLFFFFVAIGIEIFIGYPFRAFIQDNSPFILFNSDCN